MAARAWCGWCGHVFGVDTILEAGAAGGVGHCPRCSRDFAPSYAVTLVALLRAVADGSATRTARTAIADIAPHLHLEGAP